MTCVLLTYTRVEFDVDVIWLMKVINCHCPEEIAPALLVNVRAMPEPFVTEVRVPSELAVKKYPSQPYDPLSFPKMA